MDFAKDQKLIAVNPTDGCALPKLEHREMKTLPVEQLTSFLREAKETGVFEMYYIELATGLRRGELLGLKWEDIDLEQGNLRVQRQVCRIDGEIVEAPLKTKNAYRVLPLSADAVEVLRDQRRKRGGSQYVFPSSTGGPISPDSVLHMLHRVLKRAGLPKVRFHDLRHPYVSLTTKKLVPLYEKISRVLYAISIRFPGKTNTFSISSSDSASVSLSASAISRIARSRFCRRSSASFVCSAWAIQAERAFFVFRNCSS